MSGTTSLFITPGYRFKVVDLLVTNFHVPSSSLIVMVAAFMGEAWRSAYEHALRSGYRFLSFGDAMLARRS
jgi:S-adenosylmethionine:tRNA ribosyltransferase-isomerase